MRKKYITKFSQNLLFKEETFFTDLSLSEHDLEIFWVHFKISICIRFTVLDLISHHGSHAPNVSNC